MLQVEVDKEDLVNMIKGLQPSMGACIELEKTGLMVFTGNQYNPRWSWDERKLYKYNEEFLFKFYKATKQGLVM